MTRIPRRTILRAAVLGAGLLSLSSRARACGWDRDTVWIDALYMHDVLAILVGRFPRNPPLYYQMRLDRMTRQLAAHPGDLAAYDDAAVASDRLGRADEAIALLEKKKAQLDALADSDTSKKEHLYRYLSNQGTSHYHRWLQRGASRTPGELADVKKARALLGEAIRVNPQAHFGREKYQVLVMDWILQPPNGLATVDIENEEEGSQPFRIVPGFIKELTRRDEALSKKYPDAARGLAGLIALGSSWESVDVFHNLALVLRLVHGKVALSAIASLRAAELVGQGQRSLHPAAPATAPLPVGFPLSSYRFEPRNWKETQALFGPITRQQYKEMKGKTNIEKEYFLLRQEADSWSAARSSYLVAQLQAGRHPDTHPDFWRDFTEPDLPYLKRARADPARNLLLEFDGERPAAGAASAGKK